MGDKSYKYIIKGIKKVNIDIEHAVARNDEKAVNNLCEKLKILEEIKALLERERKENGLDK